MFIYSFVYLEWRVFLGRCELREHVSLTYGMTLLFYVGIMGLLDSYDISLPLFIRVVLLMALGFPSFLAVDLRRRMSKEGGGSVA